MQSTLSPSRKRGLSPAGTGTSKCFVSISQPTSFYLHGTGGSQVWKARVSNLLLAAQQIVQAERADFIKVTGVEQVTDSLVVSQT